MSKNVTPLYEDTKISEKKEKDERIKKERLRIRRILKDLPQEVLKINLNLIDRAAFLKVALEYLEDDINEFGTVEEFKQTETIVYERERVSSRLHNSYVRNYSNIIKQLTALLPKAEAVDASSALLDFIRGDPRKGIVK